MINREQQVEALPWADETSARNYFDPAQQQWSESWLCRVVIGPRDMHGMKHDQRVDKAPPEDWADGVDAAASVVRAEMVFRDGLTAAILAVLVKRLEELAENYPGRASRSDYPRNKSDEDVCIHCPKCACYTSPEHGDFPCEAGGGGEHEWVTIAGVTVTCSCGDRHRHRCPDALARLGQRTDSATPGGDDAAK